MKKAILAVSFLILMLLTIQVQAGGKIEQGTLGQSKITVASPEKWNGNVLILAHGLRRETSPLMADFDSDSLPYKQLISEGWIVASTSFRRNGYIIDEAILDINELRDHIVKTYGKPKYVFLSGRSMGGRIVTMMAESMADKYDGAVAVGAALGVGMEGYNYTFAPKMQIVFLTNQSEQGDPKAYIANTRRSAVRPSFWLVKRDGHCNTTGEEELAAIRAVVAYRTTGNVVLDKDGTINPKPTVSVARFVNGKAYAKVAKYGDMQTEFVATDMEKLGIKKGDKFRVSFKDKSFTVLFGTTYDDVPSGEWVAFMEAGGLLRIARNWENAKDTLGCKEGDEICISPIAKDPTSTEILHWPGGKSAAVALTFDDNLRSQLANAIPELEKRGYRGTFFIVAQWLDGPAASEGLAEQWQTIFHHGHEIGCHGYSHAHLPMVTPEEMQRQTGEAKIIIERLIGTGNCLLFRFPWGDWSEDADKVVQSIFPLNRVDLAKNDQVFLAVSGDADESINMIDEAVKNNGVFISINHGVGGDFVKISVLGFERVLDHLDSLKTQVWVAPLGDVTKYSYLRSNAKLDTTDGVKIVFPEGFDRQLFNSALYLRTHVPADWKYIVLKRGTTQTVMPTIEMAGKRYVDYQLSPGETAHVDRFEPVDTSKLKLQKVASFKFENESDLAKWQVIDGNPEVKDGVLSTGKDGCRMVLKDLKVEDVLVRGRFRILGDLSEHVYLCSAGLFFRGSNFRAGTYNHAAYELCNQPERSDFRPGRALLWNQWTTWDPSAPLDVWPDQLVASGDAGITTGKWHSFELVVVGDQVCYAVDGKTVIQSSGISKRPGLMGLYGQNTGVEFDDIEICRVDK